MFVKERFELDSSTCEELRSMEPDFGFNGYGEFIFYRTYSRTVCEKCRCELLYNREEDRDYCPNCGYAFQYGQETWADCVIRVINGVFSIRKDHYRRNYINWCNDFWQHYARHMALSMFRMEWMPPGRGLWAMGTNFVYQRGSMALNNCALCVVGDEIGKVAHWIMDALMCGCGVGFNPIRNDDMEVWIPTETYEYVIDDSREGWCVGTQLLIDSYLTKGAAKPDLKYHKIRKKGTPIRGFGGVCSGPEPLMWLHKQIEQFFGMYVSLPWYNSLILKADIINCIGCAVVAGNVRRCFPATTQVSTISGLRSISDLKINDEVLTLNGYKKIRNVFQQGQRKLVRVWLESGRYIDCTPNHKFAILSSLEGDIDWVEAGMLNDEDVLLLQGESLKMQGTIESDEAYFYGVLNGDGHVHDRRNEGVGSNLTIAMSSDPTGIKIGDKVIEYLNKCGLDPKFSEVKEHQHKIKVYDTSFALSMLPYKIPNQSPVIPESVKTGSAEARGAYLAGICDADGQADKWIVVSSKYMEFVRAVQRICVSLGIDTRINIRQGRTIEGYNDGQPYDPEIQLIVRGFISKRRMIGLVNPYMVKQFPEIKDVKNDATIPIRFALDSYDRKMISTKLELYHLTNNQKYDTIHKNAAEYCPDFWRKVYPCRVQEVEELDEVEETWDIEVEDDHCFFAEGILVHNSAELLAGQLDDIVDLKDPSKYPHREGHLWMSNNSVLLEADEDFERLGEIASRVVRNGEPGYINLRNLPFGRIGKPMDGLRIDPAVGFNPCGEINLEDRELCCLSETCPTRCETVEQWYKACEYATVYAATVTLLPTHRPETNAVMLRNRRIGVGIIDVVGWNQEVGTTRLIKYLREGYRTVRKIAEWTNTEAGVPLPIRHTTIKPGGTTPKLPGLRSGWQWPTFGEMIRRTRVAQDQPVHRILKDAGVPYEKDVVSMNTDVFEWPIDQGDGGRIRPATDVSLWEQAMMLVLLQREWSDNAVSNTLYFKPRWPLIKVVILGESFYEHDVNPEVMENEVVPWLPISWEDFLEVQDYEWEGYRYKLIQDKWTSMWEFHVLKYDPHHEEDSVEPVLAAIAPLTKSVAVLPHSPAGAYKQMPEEGISHDEYVRKIAKLKLPIDWSKLRGSNGIDERYCEGASCTIERVTT